ncbi:Glu/Leu/Phe/Val dehydrogenase dimerization domain-containing protein [Haloechinothrix salitolerans]|uniref:Glu/Leu/Phe/Val dehydrogenase dimerization domain-containing protein n=1 Tax=Haloechinothrix salitolerans TaxID=926830 RepID=A0ABW2BWR1_9PSEU
MTSYGVFSRASGHEEVIFCHDDPSGLRAIIAIHSTALGPALGGVRMRPYTTEAEALNDVLLLSQGMSYKSALAGVGLGGGKAVIIGDPATGKTDGLLHAFARRVNSLGGTYITAPDAGTTVRDMDVIGEHSKHVVGRSPECGGFGDPSPYTALGVFRCMLASMEFLRGSGSLRDRVVGVEGAGKVGYHLVRYLIDGGARVAVTDVDEGALARIRSLGDVRTVASADELLTLPLDIFAPCALGGSLTAERAASIQARIVCGAANNQLAEPDVATSLHRRGILYAPDYLANAGGLVHVAGELRGFDSERTRSAVMSISDTLGEVYQMATADHVSPAEAADRLARRRIAVGAS